MPPTEKKMRRVVYKFADKEHTLHGLMDLINHHNPEFDSFKVIDLIFRMVREGELGIVYYTPPNTTIRCVFSIFIKTSFFSKWLSFIDLGEVDKAFHWLYLQWCRKQKFPML